mmetsp:Transcript_37337/g.93256  ORF Transcript_37337/g.93256 Transcript_37337/m.93256 type:complete len:292 (-) Transcript_37337:67-942(-)
MLQTARAGTFVGLSLKAAPRGRLEEPESLLLARFLGDALQGVRLGHGDIVDEEADAALGNDVSGAVAKLDADDRVGAVEAEHREDVHDRVRAPRDDGRPADHRELRGDRRVRLGLDRALEADQESVDDIEEGEHGGAPPHPAHVEVALNDQLSGVAEHDHQAREEAERRRHRRCLLGVELHDEHNLDQQERHGEEPIHVTVGVVERLAGDGRSQRLAIHGRRERVRLRPRVEDADVVVRGDEGHEPGDHHRGLVLLVHGTQAEPEEDGGGHHARHREAQRVVHEVKLPGRH